ncbi:hypothetical protein [Deinococcus aquatilis]|uniref:hypothetical protein n=1 Tax=Deinococcus aquatilis TaxID=519440 RepID=UPI00035CB0E2|nr:hypothetical protein [Deinococcus aquatilis]
MTKTKKTPTSNKPRVVYEVKGPQGTMQVEATTTAELRDVLAPLLQELDPYAVQAVARLASIERATITAIGWTVRRVGVLQFQADQPDAPTPQKVTRKREKISPTAVLPSKVDLGIEAALESLTPRPQEADQRPQSIFDMPSDA